MTAKNDRYETQRNNILSHLATYGSITPKEALELYGCFRLAARIFELRRGGTQIATKIMRDKSTAHNTYASYTLA